MHSIGNIMYARKKVQKGAPWLVFVHIAKDIETVKYFTFVCIISSTLFLTTPSHSFFSYPVGGKIGQCFVLCSTKTEIGGVSEFQTKTVIGSTIG
jgi:hypothetical protein